MEGEDEALRFSGVKLLIDGQVAESRFLIHWEKGKRMHSNVETHTYPSHHHHPTHTLFICVSCSVCGSMKSPGKLLRTRIYSVEELEFSLLL